MRSVLMYEIKGEFILCVCGVDFKEKSQYFMYIFLFFLYFCFVISMLLYCDIIRVSVYTFNHCV